MSSRTATEDNDSFKTFKKWLIASGFHPPVHLKLVTYRDTGLRGLMTTKHIEANECLISIPENVLITTRTVMSSAIGPSIKSFRPKLSPLQCLCAFLMVERFYGDNSKWSPYIAVVPQSYTTPPFWPSCAVRSLPSGIQESIRKQKADLKSEFEKLKPFIKLIQIQLHLPSNMFDFKRFRWAWYSVNTRCIYMLRQSPLEDLNQETDCYALAPFLDLLNHSCQAEVRAGFNTATRTYDIITLKPIAKFEQVHISYGFHDNAKLLLEYGFVLSRNPHSVIMFTIEELRKAVTVGLGLPGLTLENDVSLSAEKISDLCCTYDGPSWCLTSAVDLFLNHHNPEHCTNGLKGTSTHVLTVLFETRLRHSQFKKETLQLKRLSTVHTSIVLDLWNEEIDILMAGLAITKNS